MVILFFFTFETVHCACNYMVQKKSSPFGYELLWQVVPTPTLCHKSMILNNHSHFLSWLLSLRNCLHIKDHKCFVDIYFIKKTLSKSSSGWCWHSVFSRLGQYPLVLKHILQIVFLILHLWGRWFTFFFLQRLFLWLSLALHWHTSFFSGANPPTSNKLYWGKRLESMSWYFNLW